MDSNNISNQPPNAPPNSTPPTNAHNPNPTPTNPSTSPRTHEQILADVREYQTRFYAQQIEAVAGAKKALEDKYPALDQGSNQDRNRMRQEVGAEVGGNRTVKQEARRRQRQRRRERERAGEAAGVVDEEDEEGEGAGDERQSAGEDNLIDFSESEIVESTSEEGGAEVLPNILTTMHAEGVVESANVEDDSDGDEFVTAEEENGVKVAIERLQWENTMLRKLLMTKTGLDTASVEYYLQRQKEMEMK